MSLMFGQVGAQRLVTLAAEVRKRYVERIQERYSLYGLSYSPWMGIDEFLEKGKVGTLLFETYSRPSISLPPDGLEKLKVLKTFKRGESLVLDALSEWDVLNSSDVERVEHTNLMFQKAYKLLTGTSEYFSAVFPKLIDVVLPLDETLEFERGFSNHHAKGAIFLAPRHGEFAAYKLAISMAHELGHQSLMNYQTADSMIVNGQKKIPVYSGVRKTMRPAMQTYHAIAALAFMIYACDELSKSNIDRSTSAFVHARRAKYTESMQASLFDLRAKCNFTDVGRYMLQEFEGTIRGQ